MRSVAWVDDSKVGAAATVAAAVRGAPATAQGSQAEQAVDGRPHLVGGLGPIREHGGELAFDRAVGRQGGRPGRLVCRPAP